jgi:hypothetical protein
MRRQKRFFRIGLDPAQQCFNSTKRGCTMPAFTFEKISPPVRRTPATPVAATSVVPRPRGLIVQIIDRFVEVRVKRTLLQEKSAIARREPKS